MNKDEHYILDLCDEILGKKSSRQHRFDFLLGDQNKKGTSIKLPVDGYFHELKLVIEYRERQHTESVAFFDKLNKITVSGVHRGLQRKIYDERRRTELPKNGLQLIEFSYLDFNHNKQKRIIRDINADLKTIRSKLSNFLDTKGLC